MNIRYRFFSISIFLFFSFGLKSQTTPTAVTDNFSKKFPGSEVLEWEFFDKQYTASFFSGDNYVVANFDQSGNWLGSTRQLEEQELPTKVQKCWKKKFKDVQFVTALLEVEKMNQKPQYHISFESSDRLVNLVYNRKGKIKNESSELIQPD